MKRRWKSNVGTTFSKNPNQVPEVFPLYWNKMPWNWLLTLYTTVNGLHKLLFLPLPCMPWYTLSDVFLCRQTVRSYALLQVKYWNSEKVNVRVRVWYIYIFFLIPCDSSDCWKVNFPDEASISKHPDPHISVLLFPLKCIMQLGEKPRKKFGHCTVTNHQNDCFHTSEALVST